LNRGAVGIDVAPSWLTYCTLGSHKRQTQMSTALRKAAIPPAVAKRATGEVRVRATRVTGRSTVSVIGSSSSGLGHTIVSPSLHPASG